MHQLYLLLSEYKVTLYSSESRSVLNQFELPEFSGNVESYEQGISEVLEKEKALKSVKVNIILYQRLLSFFHLQFPPIGRKKIGKILPYELENSLIMSSSECYFNYNCSRLKAPARTEVYGFAIEKMIFNRLVDRVKYLGCDVASLTPLVSLLDIKIRGTVTEKSFIFLRWESNILRFFVYIDNFLKGYSFIMLNHYRLNENWKGLEVQINQKLKSIQIVESEIVKIIQGDNCNLSSQIISDYEIELTSDIFRELDDIEDDFSELIAPAVISNKSRINLTHFELFIFKEFKKYRKALIGSILLLAIWVGVTVGQLGYQISLLNQEKKEVGKKHSQMISKYLPKGASRTNVIKILKEELTALQERKKIEQRFLKREYGLAGSIKDISLIKNKVPSLHISKLSQSDRIVSINGKVSSFVDFDVFKDELAQHFPKQEYRTKINQKSSGDNSIRFLISIRKL
ncbi:MAG: hypothetical protein GY786_24515 [Proteobacteria bacterium]|nr:hypothetical protein [Pseudomonadota bacterium]